MESITVRESPGARFILRQHISTRTGRDLKYDCWSCDLLCSASSPDLYRINLQQGPFLSPLSTRSPVMNLVTQSKLHGLVACGGEDGDVECFDLRVKSSVGRISAVLPVGSDDQGVTAIAFDEDAGFQMAVGNREGTGESVTVRESPGARFILRQYISTGMGRDLEYDCWPCDLLCSASSPDLYRINLQQGPFLSPLSTRSPVMNFVTQSKLHGLVACGGEDGDAECFDLRVKSSVGRISAVLPVGSDDQGVTAIALDEDAGFQMAVGNREGKMGKRGILSKFLIRLFLLLGFLPLSAAESPGVFSAFGIGILQATLFGLVMVVCVVSFILIYCGAASSRSSVAPETSPVENLTFPIVKFSTLEKETELECSICLTILEDLDEVRVLLCSHIYHRACLDKWLTTKSTCPLCRIQVVAHIV